MQYGDYGWPAQLTTDGIRYAGNRAEAENTQRSMLLDEIRRLYAAALPFKEVSADEGRYWLTLLRLFTGARIKELCQLHPKDDIREHNGVLCLLITDEGDDPVERVKKTGKNARRSGRTLSTPPS